jgi:hypothetical protein
VFSRFSLKGGKPGLKASAKYSVDSSGRVAIQVIFLSRCARNKTWRLLVLKVESLKCATKVLARRYGTSKGRLRFCELLPCCCVFEQVEKITTQVFGLEVPAPDFLAAQVASVLGTSYFNGNLWVEITANPFLFT